ncbi:MAG: LysR family transcriptional regulator [Deltaproteobacteria bacterium]|nr:LysR family transcriptional regulator [Deltaproteobacteria bacterium]
MQIVYRLWIEEQGQTLVGQGRINLLEAIDEYQSLHKAAAAMNMSYRAAWGRIKSSEERLGVSLVDHSRGRGGMKLTEEGRSIISIFKSLTGEMDRVARESTERLQKIARLRKRTNVSAGTDNDDPRTECAESEKQEGASGNLQILRGSVDTMKKRQ